MPSVELQRSTTERGSLWRLGVAILVICAACGPFLFGLPVEGLMSAADANFALLLVHGYILALHAGHWWPRWLPAANSGFGAPVFYYYGRLPFLVSALIGTLLHCGNAASLLLGFCLFRILAFWSSRFWLRRHVDAWAADCGALVFTALPFAMLYNPIVRVGFAETAATALLPFLFLLADEEIRARRDALRHIALLAVVYGAIALIHLPQCMLGFAVIGLYSLLRAGGYAFLVQAAGALGGLLLAADAVLPALRMQALITPGAWENSPYVNVRNNFLFTPARYHLMRLLSGEIWIYGTWIFCMGLVLLALFHPRLQGQRRDKRLRALWITLALSLLAMTPVFWPAWVYIGPLRKVQFPWRLMPAALVAAGGLAAALLADRPSRRRLCMGLLGILVAVQLADVGMGAFASLSSYGQRHPLPATFKARVPKFVPWSRRESPLYADPRSSAPEYIPAEAHRAGWHIPKTLLAPADRGAVPPPPPAGLRETEGGDGAISLQGRLAAPLSLDLPLFYFPDESASGSPKVQVQPDVATGMVRLQLPAGAVALQIAHTATPRSVMEGQEISAAGAVLIVLCFGASFLRREQTKTR
jgi:hypothetical protein